MATPVDDEMVMMHLESNRYYGLNAMGRRIWELIETPTPITAVCQQLLTEFDVEPEICEREVLAFLTEMQDGNVIRVLPATA